MAYRPRKTLSNLSKLACVFALVLTTFMPAFAPRAQAFLGIADFGFDIDPAFMTDRILDAATQVVAKRLIDNMVQSTIAWANTGFNGNPAYVTSPGKFLGDTANGAVGDYIAGTPLKFLCSPFQAQIKISLQKIYTKSFQPQCTLSEIGVNLESFYKNFDEGGWNAWFNVTQNDSNNPYGAFIGVKLDIDQQLANALSINKQQLEINSGFLNFSKCAKTNAQVAPPGDVQFAYNNGEHWALEEVATTYPLWQPTKSESACVVQGPTETPGAVIKSQLDKVLPAGLDKLISVEHVDQLVSAFLNGLLQRYVFGPQGLFNSDHANYDPSPIDLENPDTSLGWVHCAEENQFCSFSGSKTVRFGSGSTFNYLLLSNGTECTANIFGDPGSATKGCDYLGTSGSNGGGGGGGGGNGLLSCSTADTTVNVGDGVLWDLYSTYPDIAYFRLSGTEVYPGINTASSSSYEIVYHYSGVKTLSAAIINSDNLEVASSTCTNSVTVTQH